MQSQSAYPDLLSKTVLITGSSKALGAQTALRFAEQGARVMVHGRDPVAIERTVRHIAEIGGEAYGISADLTSAASVADLYDAVQTRFGVVDILACFAGGQGHPVPILQMSEAQWRSTLDVDLTSKFLTVSAFAPAMAEKGSGAIILMSSSAGRAPSQASAAYGAAQAGTLMFMRQLAQELAPKGVRVNAIAPSIVRNEKLERTMPDAALQRVAQSIPLGRIGEPDDVADAALFLASVASSWMTGAVLDITGGRVMV